MGILNICVPMVTWSGGVSNQSSPPYNDFDEFKVNWSQINPQLLIADTITICQFTATFISVDLMTVSRQLVSLVTDQLISKLMVSDIAGIICIYIYIYIYIYIHICIYICIYIYI